MQQSDYYDNGRVDDADDNDEMDDGSVDDDDQLGPVVVNSLEQYISTVPNDTSPPRLYDHVDIGGASWHSLPPYSSNSSSCRQTGGHHQLPGQHHYNTPTQQAAYQYHDLLYVDIDENRNHKLATTRGDYVINGFKPDNNAYCSSLASTGSAANNGVVRYPSKPDVGDIKESNPTSYFRQYNTASGHTITPSPTYGVYGHFMSSAASSENSYNVAPTGHVTALTAAAMPSLSAGNYLPCNYSPADGSALVPWTAYN